jgi:hypothetical protein
MPREFADWEGCRTCPMRSRPDLANWKYDLLWCSFDVSNRPASASQLVASTSESVDVHKTIFELARCGKGGNCLVRRPVEACPHLSITMQGVGKRQRLSETSKEGWNKEEEGGRDEK